MGKVMFLVVAAVVRRAAVSDFAAALIKMFWSKKCDNV